MIVLQMYYVVEKHFHCEEDGFLSRYLGVEDI